MSHAALLVRETEPSVDTDRIDYDAWLLPPSHPSPTEHVIRHCSTIAGPIAFVAALAIFVQHLV
ncbi:hypothetical protein AB5I41_17180 [Sphingomonas sp. MMS24-JH45]